MCRRSMFDVKVESQNGPRPVSQHPLLAGLLPYLNYQRHI